MGSLTDEIVLKSLSSHAIDIIALLFLAALLWSSFTLNDHRKRPFINGIAVTVLVIIAEAGTVIFTNDAADIRGLNIISNMIGFSLTPLIPVVLISIFDQDTLKQNRIILLPFIVNCLMTLLSPFFGWIFSVDAGNNYSRGSLFLVFVVAYITGVVFLAISFSRSGYNQMYPIRKRLLYLALFAIAGTSVQLVFPAVFSSWHIVTMTLFLMYVLLSEFDSSFDTLTGLHNRAAFDKACREFRDMNRFAVIITDINDFKLINDNYGHEFGDLVLKKVAEIVKISFGGPGYCFRVGGDEFYIICKNTDRDKIEDHLKRMTTALSKEHIDEKPLPGLAYGYSIRDGSGGSLDFQKMIVEADQNMYACKKMQKEIRKEL